MELLTLSRQNCFKDYKKHFSRTFLIFIMMFLIALVCTDEDYYKLLGVKREASNREIRQAFKKLALTMHPDKNQNDPDAHEKFLKINRAYEVLKDEELRKKYDKYGEKGLQDHQEGRQYESWNFYRYDFGIYDDDLEIITLDRGDFDAAVNSGELWFVNFYSPRCSHCHDLAPTWREFAKEMDGAIRIGAVNCGDNRMFCRTKGISSYPSLYIFRAGMSPVKYFGDRSRDNLIEFAMQYITSKVTELGTANFVKAIKTAFDSGIGWLITFCSDTGDCLSKETKLKLAGMLFLSSLDAREVYGEVMKHLPPLEMLSATTLKDKVTYHRWLVFFSFGEMDEVGANDFKKLKVLLKSDHIQVGRFDCQSANDVCSDLYIHSPNLAVFKGKGLKDYEVYHGKKLLYDIVSFAKESVTAHVVTLGPQNFPSNKKEPWLVDFFAPWCPPCLALLPELRKASRQLNGQLHFGTLDCTIHESLCNTYNIRAYPTTLVFNQSSVLEYEGHHSAEQILEFIQDLMNPSVVTLTPETFEELVKRRKKDEMWMVDFYAPWCGPCQALMPEWKRMARLLNGLINVGSVDCQKYYSFCHQESVRAYPEVRLFPQSSKKASNHYIYNGWHRDAYSLRAWGLGYLPRASVDLTHEDFTQKVLHGKDSWVIDFYAPWCGPCQSFAPEFELLARTVKGKVKAGKVDCQSYPYTCQTAGIRAYPTVKFYPFLGGKKKNEEGEYMNTRDVNVIAETINKRLEEISVKTGTHSSSKRDEL
ncbi:dnaJ homolog subfamily C member 10 isoform X2 [Protopterus annectens]|uniref:dnaJ homolog subfamily C member 10 isoform X2 n=1 Tax=Protopterus annectens TaxID=7888 RepID=UPI001CFC39F7|nr:dnaJ homolog subfamily C member 10 isoform X2 [Protopterus annectens]